MENNNTANTTDKTSGTYPDLPKEKNRKRRGHAFYDGLGGVPALYETEAIPPEDKILHAHYFVGGADWYVAEVDPVTMEAFGWARIVPGGGEWGYTDLTDLEGLRVSGVFVVERDLHWEPLPFKEVIKDPRF